MARLVDLGMVGYGEAYRLQEDAVRAVAAGEGEEVLFLLEHPPVYTTGSGGNGKHILDARIRPLRINRGGDITFHGPGQLVGYPLVHLGRRGRDLHRYLRFLEELLIAAVASFRVDAYRVDGRTGIWTNRGKLASIGVGVRQWVTMHGFALNVCNDLSPFLKINPCGMEGCPLTNLAQESGDQVTVASVKRVVADLFEEFLEAHLPESFDVRQQPS